MTAAEEAQWLHSVETQPAFDGGTYSATRDAEAHKLRVSEARQTAKAVVDGLGTDEGRIGAWITTNEADGLLIREVIRVARERRESSVDE